MGVALGNRLSNRGCGKKALVLSGVGLSLFLWEDALACLNNSAGWQETETHYSGIRDE